MAYLDELIADIKDRSLRQKIETAVAEMKRRQRFGLVFEEHVPEIAAIQGLPVAPGVIVQRRDSTNAGDLYQVASVTSRGIATIEPIESGPSEKVPLKNLLVIKRFGDPIYAALKSLGAVYRGDPEKPCHAVINGENYHALQLLIYLYEGQVDCIYIDPPYNTGARDWKYNNRYVDKNDSWRHSKWLSFLDKRLRLARRLLKPDGVLIVTVDENEVHHLGMLLERLFPEALRQMVTICINPSGVSGDGFSRVDEYAFFCFFGGTQPSGTPDDMLTEESAGNDIEWESLLRRGNAWYRETRKNLCYPVLLDPAAQRIVGVGEPFSGKDETRRRKVIDGHPAAWPVRRDGRLGIWRVDGKCLESLVQNGYAYVSSRDDERGTWTVKYLMRGTIKAIADGRIEVTGRGKRGEALLQATVARRTTAKTIWHRGRHTAGGAGGTQALAAFLGERALFPFPKSVYAVRDCILAAIGNRENALIGTGHEKSRVIGLVLGRAPLLR